MSSFSSSWGKAPPEGAPEGTQVDLGDDLLQSSASEAESTASPPPSAKTSGLAADELDSARILLNEGLLADARKALFRVLRNEPANAVARMLLEEIRSQELGALLGADASARSTLTYLKGEVSEDSLREPDLTLKELDEALGLGLAPGADETRLCEQWIAQALPRGASARERMDWAVALVVLDQPGLAVDVLEQARQDKESFEFQALLSETCLLAGEGERARTVAELALRDPTLPAPLRTEFTYLRARALEVLGRRAEAQAIFKVLATHRDSKFRAGKL